MFNTIANITKAQTLLSSVFSKHYSELIDIIKFLEEYIMYTDNWTSFSVIKDELDSKLEDLYVKLSYDEMDVRVVFEYTVFNKLQTSLMDKLYQENFEKDQFYFEKCIELGDVGVSAEQLGASEIYAIPLIASVVELANLDNYKCPLEKIQCLCTTYDLIFAELKSALIDIISKYSDKEHDIPIINNIDIIPILMIVIIKSRLVHLYSNMYFMEAFLGSLRKNDCVMHVLNTFKEALTRLGTTTVAVLKPSSKKICRDLDLTDLIELTNDIQKEKMANEVLTPVDGHRLRITNLIITSTNENNVI